MRSVRTTVSVSSASREKGGFFCPARPIVASRKKSGCPADFLPCFDRSLRVRSLVCAQNSGLQGSVTTGI
jgi:hypothetical protein